MAVKTPKIKPTTMLERIAVKVAMKPRKAMMVLKIASNTTRNEKEARDIL